MPQCSDFYTVELVNATDEGLAPQTTMPAINRMIATVMLQNGFEPGFGLGRNSQWIIDLVRILAKGSKYGLGYTPTHEDMKMKKNKDQELAKLIPHLYRSFSI